MCCPIQECFKMPQSCGVLGGKPNLAYYFIGFVGESKRKPELKVHKWVVTKGDKPVSCLANMFSRPSCVLQERS